MGNTLRKIGSQTLKPALVVPALFVGLLLNGLLVVSDYSISTDEVASRTRGGLAALYMNYKTGRLLFSKDKVDRILTTINEDKNADEYQNETSILTHVSRDHGTFFDLVLIGTEVITGVKSSRELFVIRHIATYLFYWVSLIFFYL
ncbi:MAG: hypothetical protein AAFO69_14410, partial [Bacteroidota bacterium]